MKTNASLVLGIGLTATLTVPSLGFIQERTPDGSQKFHWNLAAVQPNISAGRIVYVINKKGSDDVSFTSLNAAVDASFATWGRVNGSVLDFVAAADSSTSPSGTKPDDLDDVNVIFWDEDPRDGAENPPLIPLRWPYCQQDA